MNGVGMFPFSITHVHTVTNQSVIIKQPKSNILEINESYQSAKRKATLLEEFYSHMTTYLVANSLFFLINFLTAPGDWWVLYPLIGWGVCLTIHGLETIVKVSGFWDNYQSRK